MPLAVLGLRGSGSYTAGERPQSWREMILLLFPNGKAPLTALMSKMRSEPVDDPIFHWFEKDVPTQRVLATATFTNVATSISVADSSIFRAGHVVQDELTGEQMYVTVDPSTGTAITVQRGFGTTAAAASNGAADPLYIVGNVNAEGAGSPNVVYYNPTQPLNYTQIFRTPLYLTRTAMKTRLRTGNAREEAKREALELHSMELEKAFIFGQPYQTTGANGQPMNATGGLISFLGQDASFTNIYDFTASPVTINTWENLLESAFKFGSSEKLMLAGSTAINVINGMVKKASVMNVVPGGESYGMKLTEYVCPFGSLYIKVHPLFSIHPTYRGWALIVDLDKLVFRYIDDTDFRPNVQANDVDGEKDEFLTEAGMECQHQKAHCLAKGMLAFTPS
jgi:uncharacterized protein DUF5309